MTWNPLKMFSSRSSLATTNGTACATAQQPADPSLPQIPGYEVLQKIAEGGMATVYKARREGGGLVAVKLLDPELAKNPVLLKRFEQEFKAASRLEHPGIIRSLDFGQAEVGPYLVMEYVAGESLGDKIQREGALPPAEAIRLINEVGKALDYAHQEGVIHRDIKPDNILLTPDGHARVTDFGLVKQTAQDFDLTRPGQGLGTPNFIAPEQLINAKTIDRRCDVYALGATLYMAVTGQCPFAGRTLPQVLKKKATNELALPRQLVPTLSEQLEHVILRTMHPDLGQRPSSCAQFMWELSSTKEATAAKSASKTSIKRPVTPRVQTPVAESGIFVAQPSGERALASSAQALVRARLSGHDTVKPSDGSVGWQWWLAAAVLLGIAAGFGMAIL